MKKKLIRDRCFCYVYKLKACFMKTINVFQDKGIHLWVKVNFIVSVWSICLVLHCILFRQFSSCISSVNTVRIYMTSVHVKRKLYYHFEHNRIVKSDKMWKSKKGTSFKQSNKFIFRSNQCIFFPLSIQLNRIWILVTTARAFEGFQDKFQSWREVRKARATRKKS